MTENDTTPRRVQLKRTKGWRLPPNTVVVSRPSKWGNPYRPWSKPTAATRAMSVALFARELKATIADPTLQAWGTTNLRNIADSLADLRGKNLACWCPLDQPCHADVLLELANAEVR